MASSRLNWGAKKRKRPRRARKQSEKNIQDNKNADVAADATKNDKNCKKTTEEKTELSQMRLGRIHHRVMPIPKPCFDGETSGNSTATILSNDRKQHIACKPCSVVLERLRENEIANLLSKQGVGSVKKRKKHVRKGTRFNYRAYLQARRTYYHMQRLKNIEKLKYDLKKKIEEDTKKKVKRINEECDAINGDEKINDQLRACDEKPFAEITKESKSIRMAFENSGHKSSSSEHFRLSPNKNAAKMKNNCKKISPIEGKNRSEEIGTRETTNNSGSKSRCKSLSRKRSLIHTENDEAVAPNKKKQKKVTNAELDDCETLIAPNSTVGNSVSDQLLDRANVIDGSEILSDESSCKRMNFNVESETPVQKNLSISVVKLSHLPDSAEDERKVDVNTLEDNIYSCARVCVYQRKSFPYTPKKITPNKATKFRSKKITDYFVTLVKKSVLPESNVRAINQVPSDSALKKKYGIRKEAVVSLVDCKKFKIQTTCENAASEIEKPMIEDAKLSLTLDSFVTPVESTPPPSISLQNKNFSQSENESSTIEERSSTEVDSFFLVHQDVEERPLVLLNACESSTKNNESLCVEKCSSIENVKVSLAESLTITGGLFGSGNMRGSPNRASHPKNRFFIENHFYTDEEYSQKDWTFRFQSKCLSKSNPTLHSLLVAEDGSSDCSPTPSTPKGQDSYKRSSSLSPKKSRHLVVGEINTSESQLCETKIGTKSDKVLGKNCNDLMEKEKDTSVVDKGLKICPTVSSATKSPPNKKEIKSEVIFRKPNTRLPLNTMTCLNFRIIDKNGSYLSLNSAPNNVVEVDRTVNEETINPVDNAKNSPRATTVKNHAENDSLQKINALSPELKSKKPDQKQSIEISDKPACTDMETSAKKESASASVSRTIEKETDNGQCKDMISGEKRNQPAVLILEKVLSIENHNGAVPVFFINGSIEKSKIPNQSVAESLQQGDLVIDMSEAEVDAAIEKKDLTPDKSCAVSSVSEIVPVDEASDKSTVMSTRECVMCKKKYTRVSDLKRHLNVHIKDTSSCILCDKKLSKDNAVEHYFEHCCCAEENELNYHACDICHKKFRTLSGIKHHVKVRHKVDKKRMKTRLRSKDSNQCTICKVTFNSKYQLSKHLFSHTEGELQNAYKEAMASQYSQPVATLSKAETPVPQDKSNDTSTEDKSKNPEEASVKSATTTSETPAIPGAATPSNCGVSICVCHRDERLQISGSVIIEVALTCEQCKTFFKTRKCFKDHYANASCKWSEKAVAIPAMFCNKCCVILSSLQEMHSHLKHHAKPTLKTKSSFLCKLCNIYFFGIGSLFYTHWFNHCDNPLFMADHASFPNNFKVKIVEPEPTMPPSKDDPMENLFVAEHQCHDCQEPFETEDDMRKHLNASNSCSKKVISRNKVTENPKVVFKITCSICNKEFNDKPGFDDHMKDHKDIGDFLEVSKLLILSSKVDQRSCEICKTEFETATIYREHLKRHEIIQEKFVCNYCSVTVDSVQKFEQHSGDHKGTLKKPVTCKVTFTTAKFHCKPCKIWFDNQTTLDEHLSMHKKQTTAEPPAAESLPVAAGKNIFFVISDQECSRLVHAVSDGRAQKSCPSNASSGKNRNVFQISDDSNTSDVEIIMPVKPGEQRKEPTVRNSSIQKKEALSNPKKNKPAFLRVKNLKELLPYPSCTTCKIEFKTPIKLSNHVCNKTEIQGKDSTFKHTCTICNNYKCNSDDDMKLHRLSHSSLRSAPLFDKSWFNVLSIQSEKPVLKCNVCAKYGCESVTMMRDHFINVHPNLYRPVYTCRVCQSFNTTVEQEIRRHEAGHFKKSPEVPPLCPTSTSDKNSTSVQPVNSNPKTVQNTPTTRAVDKQTDCRYIKSPIPPVRNSASNYQQTTPLQSIIEFTNNTPQLQGNQSSNNFQRTIQVSAASTSGNNTPVLQQLAPLLQPVENRGNIQQPIPVIVPTNSVNNSLPFTVVNDGSNFQHITPNPATTNSKNNPPSDQPINSPQQWVTSTIQPLQNQNPTNNDSPFNNVTNVIRTVPSIALLNTVYCCSICKNFETSSKKLLSAHETLHEFIQSDKTARLCQPCAECPNFSCNTHDQLNTHFATFHGTNTPMNPPLTRTIMKCSNCPLTFRTPNELAQHVYKSHTYFIVNRQPNEIRQNMYPFGCHLCSLRFANDACLRSHIYASHPKNRELLKKTTNTVQSVCRCEICGIYFVSQVALSYHMGTHNVVYQ